jgi:hypothetical protein
MLILFFLKYTNLHSYHIETYSIQYDKKVLKCENEIIIQVQVAFRSPKRQYQKTTFKNHIIVKTLGIEKKERTLKVKSAKTSIKAIPMRITTYFSTEILKIKEA